MTKDIEADYWKNQFVHLLHKNMVRINAEPLTVKNAQDNFNKFSYAHPEYKVEIQNSSSYIVWETFVTPAIKLRLFIQNQVKASLLQKNGSDLVKIADTKFPYNPFPEIIEFLNNKNSLQVELEHVLDAAARNERKLKLAEQFIKAALIKKYEKHPDVIWSLNRNENNFSLTVKNKDEERIVILTPDNFSAEINQL